MYGNKELVGFCHKGYTYDYDVDYEDDNAKTNQYAVDVKTGERHHIAWSPYSNMTREEFCLYIDLGRPESISNGNLNRKDLDYIKGAGLITWIFDLKSRSSDWHREGVRVTAASSRLVHEIVAETWPTCGIINLRQDVQDAAQ